MFVKIHRLLFRAVSEQFQSNFRAVSEQFKSISAAVLEQFQSSFRALSEQFQSNFRAVSEQFKSISAAVLEQFQSSLRALPEQFQISLFFLLFSTMFNSPREFNPRHRHRCRVSNSTKPLTCNFRATPVPFQSSFYCHSQPSLTQLVNSMPDIVTDVECPPQRSR